VKAVQLTVSGWLAEYRRAWIERDPDAAAALFTDDALYREQPYDEPFVGPSGVRDYWARVTATQEAVELEYGTPVVVGDRAAVEWWVTMLNGGAEITLAGEFMLRFDENGLCRELREYWHVGEGRRRPPPGWGT
jgi:SnoaL-like domain